MVGTAKFSPSAGWDQVRQWLGRHVQAFIALAGVFFLLPQLVLSFFGPAIVPPVIDQNNPDITVLFEQMQAAFAPLIPWFIVLTIVQMAGQLAIIAVVSTRKGASVGEAIGTGFKLAGYLILAQLVLGLALGLVLMIFGLIAGVAAAVFVALGFLVFLAIFVVAIYLLVRFSLVSAVLVTEEARWPIPLLRRSWELTKGNTLPIFGFYLIIFIVFLVISIVASLIFGLVLTPMGAAGVSILAVVTGAISAAGTAIFALLPVAVWYQLAGNPSTPEVFS